MEEIPADRWLEEVYKPDIESQQEKIYKKPGYGPSDL